MNTQEIVGAENRYVLHNVSWDTYESLLEDFTDCAAQNFTYTDEILEIMSPSRKHEKIAELLSEIVKSFAYHDGIRFDSDRASTLKRNDLEKGVEPDASFYIQNEPLVRNKIELDLTKDPPPDLIIEVDITSPFTNKLDIYRELRIPEIWFYNDKKGISILHLKNDEYISVETSLSFKGMSIAFIQKVINIFETDGQSEALWFIQLSLNPIHKNL